MTRRPMSLNDTDDLHRAISRAFAEPGPATFHAILDEMEKFIPPETAKRDPYNDGFRDGAEAVLAMLRAECEAAGQ